mmetsp:Transcript_13760/g.17955  ORF Transcript_13760/g.17955 Transcript_13760/m.17955 type:complete len:285 (+) Transcript_13760:148-1002(+)|eukprot:CAMPEP_0198146512 /NCGR_PEP_ID=MMETSP1443-20131203/29618_1 /TAXON_ID=186043 /ORGANISM="Entomoneis sp., Strain CCMP2396" /LENGTH=284 /DNA_ID=CAMNT_0043810499 /DNA_START=121 /DNA_END=975 /DNA_ORIENTATION=-
MKVVLSIVTFTMLAIPCLGWVSLRPASFAGSIVSAQDSKRKPALFLADEPTSDAELGVEFDSEEQKKEAVGNLIANDEWTGLTMELSEIVRASVVEDMKLNAREFLGKEDYKVGDVSKEVDSRVKEEIAKMRGKDEYELGDFMIAMDELSKKMTEDFTGKPYEAGDLSGELDNRVKSAVSSYCGKDEYEFGDLSNTVAQRVSDRVEEFTGKPYEFGDISMKVEEGRQQWMKEFLGEEAAANYKFGDTTKKALANFTGKGEYQFGDVSKKIFGGMFGSRGKGGSD